MEGIGQVRRGKITVTNQGRGLRTETMKGLGIVTNQGRDLVEATGEKTTIDRGKGMKRGMIVRIGTRIIITWVITIL